MIVHLVQYKDVKLSLKAKHDPTESCQKCVADDNATLCGAIREQTGILCGVEEVIWKVRSIS